ncbi:GNAT family N-acetyltransferase [Acidiplasma sp.]|uniref:GNAT family N-acetyltransferase n=1 Tax=Acidiplasma sp. TaxID=1872114 RepID=UPI0031692688
MMLWKKSQKNDLEIRRATPADARGIINCMQSVMDEKVYLVSEYYLLTERGEQERLKNPDELTLICLNGSMVIGVLTLQRGLYKKNRHTANLGIAIRSGYRHMKIGTRLILEALKWAKKEGIKKVNLEVFSTNVNAIKAYRKIGFEYEGVRKHQFIIDNKYVDDVLMTFFTDTLNEN